MRLKNYIISLLVLSCAYSLSSQNEYTNGVFILNEDWYGKNNSTINFLNTDTKEFDYLLIQNNADNGNLSLGCTAQFGTVYGDNLYVISKQDQDTGEEKLTGGRVVVADAATMKIKKTIPVIYEINGKAAADGRSFVGVDETKGYIGTSNGIFILDLQSFEIRGRIEGTENPLVTGNEDNADGLGPLYRNQIGIMIRTLDYVFAIMQDRGVLVIDPQTDRVVDIIEGCFSTMTQSKDGSIWVGKNSNMNYQQYPYGDFGSTGEKWEGNQLLKINPETLEHTVVNMPEPYGINQTWYAWTAGSLCAGTHHNHLYFTYNPNKWSWFTPSYMYKYDIDNDTFSKIYDSSSEGRYFYGGAIRVNPLDDKIYASLYIDNVNQSYFFYQLDNEGNLLNQYEPVKRYWFPAMLIFPDIHEPEVTEFEPVYTENTEAFRINLSGMATDADNSDIAITKKIISVNNPAIRAGIKNNVLTIQPESTDIRDAVVTIRFNSNGKIKDRSLYINPASWPPASSVEDTEADPVKVFARDNMIFIRGLKDTQKVAIATINGQVVSTQNIRNEGIISGLPSSQIYIIRIGNKNYKIKL